MIPYEELAIAIERWRIRNGLPVGESGARTASPASAQRTTPAVAPASAPPRGAPPGPAPGARTMFGVAPGPAPARAATDLPVDLGDADVLEEELYGLDTGGFTGSGQAGYDDDAGEKTAIGSPYDQRPGANRKAAPFDVFQSGAHPVRTEDDALDALDAGADVIDEASLDDEPDHR